MSIAGPAGHGRKDVRNDCGKVCARRLSAVQREQLMLMMLAPRRKKIPENAVNTVEKRALNDASNVLGPKAVPKNFTLPMMLKWGPEFLQIRYRNLPPPLTPRLVFGFALQFQSLAGSPPLVLATHLVLVMPYGLPIRRCFGTLRCM